MNVRRKSEENPPQLRWKSNDNQKKIEWKSQENPITMQRKISGKCGKHSCKICDTTQKLHEKFTGNLSLTTWEIHRFLALSLFMPKKSTPILVSRNSDTLYLLVAFGSSLVYCLHVFCHLCMPNIQVILQTRKPHPCLYAFNGPQLKVKWLGFVQDTFLRSCFEPKRRPQNHLLHGTGLICLI